MLILPNPYLRSTPQGIKEAKFRLFAQVADKLEVPAWAIDADTFTANANSDELAEYADMLIALKFIEDCATDGINH